MEFDEDWARGESRCLDDDTERPAYAFRASNVRYILEVPN
jgi:hypothetical protein